MSASEANDDPRIADGTGAPGGAGASRVGQVSKVFGQVQPGTDGRRRQDRVEPTHEVAASRGFSADEPGRVPRVLGQAHAPRRRAFGIAIAASCFLVLPAVGGAGPSRSRTVERGPERRERRARVARALGRAEPLRARLAASRGARARLAQLQRQAATLRREQVVLAAEMKVALERRARLAGAARLARPAAVRPRRHQHARGHLRRTVARRRARRARQPRARHLDQQGGAHAAPRREGAHRPHVARARVARRPGSRPRRARRRRRRARSPRRGRSGPRTSHDLRQQRQLNSAANRADRVAGARGRRADAAAPSRRRRPTPVGDEHA